MRTLSGPFSQLAAYHKAGAASIVGSDHNMGTLLAAHSQIHSNSHSLSQRFELWLSVCPTPLLGLGVRLLPPPTLPMATRAGISRSGQFSSFETDDGVKRFFPEEFCWD